MFTSTSQTELGYQDRGHTFTKLKILSDGACLAAERSGHRDLGTTKGLLVRYENPFTGGGASVLYESKDALVDMGFSVSGSTFAVSAKQLHSNETGVWKATAPKIDGKPAYFLTNVHEHQGSLWVGDYRRLARREGKVWRTILSVEGPRRWGIISLGDSLYVMKNDTVGVWREADGNFAPLKITENLDATEIVRVSEHRVGVVDHRNLIVGSETEGFAEQRIEGWLGNDAIDAYVSALGGQYVATYDRLYRLDAGVLVPVLKATGWIAKACTGNEHILWIANGTELLCTNGIDWLVVPRALDDRTKSSTP